jgi:hypothetical protein
MAWLSVLGAALWLALFGDKAPAGAEAGVVVQPSSRSAAPRPAAAAGTSSPVLLALTPRESLWRDAEATAPVIDLFPGPAAAQLVPATAASAPPPIAPPLPFVVFGKRFDGSAWEVFLGQGERTLIVREGTVIDAQYRVESIKPPSLVVTYLPLSQQQSLAVGGAE